MKSFLLIAIACLLGPWMLWSGMETRQNYQRLATEGKDVSAQVVDRSIGFRSRGANRYYLYLRFQAEAGPAVQRRVQVNYNEYQEAATGSTVTLRYLPSDPAVCSVGEPVPIGRSSLFSGAILLASGAALLFFRVNMRRTAAKVVQHVGNLCESHYEYAAVNPNEFPHLDLAWYGASHRWLEEQGFAFLGDEENLTFKKTSKGNRTLLRAMLGGDGTWLAYLYHFKPSTPVRALGGNGFKILELQTHFANGAFVCTSNAEAAGKLDSPPGVEALHLPASTSLESVLAAHTRRVSAFLANNPGVAAGRMGNLDEVHRVQNALQRVKAAYRRNTGLTKEELQRLAGNRLDQEQIETLHADVEKLHQERQQKAA